jgi:hypothetical protein
MELFVAIIRIYDDFAALVGHKSEKARIAAAEGAMCCIDIMRRNYSRTVRSVHLIRFIVFLHDHISLLAH